MLISNLSASNIKEYLEVLFQENYFWFSNQLSSSKALENKKKNCFTYEIPFINRIEYAYTYLSLFVTWNLYMSLKTSLKYCTFLLIKYWWVICSFFSLLYLVLTDYYEYYYQYLCVRMYVAVIKPFEKDFKM